MKLGPTKDSAHMAGLIIPRSPQFVARRALVSRNPSVRATPVKPWEKKDGKESFYWNITGFPFPLEPSLFRKTIRYEVLKGKIWTFEQEQGIGLGLNVSTNVRMTVIKLKSGGLWVHAPVAPTPDCLKLLRELEAPVEHIVLPTFGYEHKVFFGPFTRKFPKAKCYVSPGQWSFPLNLPIEFFGVFGATVLKDESAEYPWSDEISFKVFSPPPLGVADYVTLSEVAFFHKPTKTLLVTDAVVFVPEFPPDIVPESMCLDQSRNSLFFRTFSPKEGAEPKDIDPSSDYSGAIKRGWARMALQSLYFGPNDLLRPQESFEAIKNKLTVSPVLKTLVYRQCKATTRAWVDAITREWDFNQIIPCHFSGPVRTSPAEFKRAFAFIYEEGVPEPGTAFFGLGAKRVPFVESPTVKRDLRVLDILFDLLTKIGAVFPDPEGLQAKKQAQGGR